MRERERDREREKREIVRFFFYHSLMSGYTASCYVQIKSEYELTV